ncbi:MAG: DEAD/DEAH box helicase family protein [Butyrivibrio sp.]|nr:DEAD/DEAH box helicase family protein [Butyrivibrio sp.]
MNNKSPLELVRSKTKEDLQKKLKTHGHCAVIRCTGFGKTWLLSDISKDYNSVLYLYPAEIIKQTAIRAIEATDGSSEERYEKAIKKEIDDELGYGFDYRNIQFMTYAKLARMSKQAIEELPDYDLIIMDELHRIGGDKTKVGAFWLMYYQRQAHIVGATATPDRSDAFDVVNEFFQGICVYPYTLHDAVQDGIIKMPYYVYCTYDIETNFKKTARSAGQDIDNPSVKEVINSRMLEASKIHNMPTIIKKTVDQYVEEKSYMKFIAFFSSIRQLHTSLNDVKEWFCEAFPKYKINVLEVTSEDANTRANLYTMNLKHKENTIDIIACVDMLNMGYHVDDLTGIVMYRCTNSSTIYIQQLGRALSTGSKTPCVVFDVVDNLHRKSMFNLATTDNRRKKNKSATKKERIKSLMSEIGNELTKEEYTLLEKYVEDNLMAKDEEAFNTVWSKINEIHKEDIYAIDYLATYREMVAKVVAEVKHERIKRAAEEYFRITCDKYGKEIPNTISELKKMKNMPPELSIFLKWQSVTEMDVLQYIDPDGTGVIDTKKISEGIKKSMIY